MNRFKLLAMATLLAVPLVNACDDDMVPPVSTGSLAGQVAIEGQGMDGVTVTLSGGVTATTAGGGAYRFDDLEAGAYTITISNYPEDANWRRGRDRQLHGFLDSDVRNHGDGQRGE